MKISKSEEMGWKEEGRPCKYGFKSRKGMRGIQENFNQLIMRTDETERLIGALETWVGEILNSSINQPRHFVKKMLKEQKPIPGNQDEIKKLVESLVKAAIPEMGHSKMAASVWSLLTQEIQNTPRGDMLGNEVYELKSFINDKKPKKYTGDGDEVGVIVCNASYHVCANEIGLSKVNTFDPVFGVAKEAQRSFAGDKSHLEEWHQRGVPALMDIQKTIQTQTERTFPFNMNAKNLWETWPNPFLGEEAKLQVVGLTTRNMDQVFNPNNGLYNEAIKNGSLVFVGKSGKKEGKEFPATSISKLEYYASSFLSSRWTSLKTTVKNNWEEPTPLTEGYTQEEDYSITKDGYLANSFYHHTYYFPIKALGYVGESWFKEEYNSQGCYPLFKKFREEVDFWPSEKQTWEGFLEKADVKEKHSKDNKFSSEKEKRPKRSLIDTALKQMMTRNQRYFTKVCLIPSVTDCLAIRKNIREDVQPANHFQYKIYPAWKTGSFETKYFERELELMIEDKHTSESEEEPASTPVTFSTPREETETSREGNETSNTSEKETEASGEGNKPEIKNEVLQPKTTKLEIVVSPKGEDKVAGALQDGEKVMSVLRDFIIIQSNKTRTLEEQLSTLETEKKDFIATIEELRSQSLEPEPAALDRISSLETELRNKEAEMCDMEITIQEWEDREIHEECEKEMSERTNEILNLKKEVANAKIEKEQEDASSQRKTLENERLKAEVLRLKEVNKRLLEEKRNSRFQK